MCVVHAHTLSNSYCGYSMKDYSIFQKQRQSAFIKRHKATFKHKKEHSINCAIKSKMKSMKWRYNNKRQLQCKS